MKPSHYQSENIESTSNFLLQISINPESNLAILEWFFELKYVKFGDIKIKSPQPGASIQKQELLKDKSVKFAFNEGKNQLERYRPIYEKMYRVTQDNVKIRYVVILFVGKEFIFFEEI